MNQVLLPLPFERSTELFALIHEIIQANEHMFKDQVEEFNKTEPNPKDRLVDYFIIGALNGKYCYAAFTRELPDWLKNFLCDCYVLAHNHLASQK